VDVARAYFTISYYPRLRRAMIMYILYKEGKADYLLPGSYRPIALENTLSKILKRVVVDYIADIAEEHALLL
jgi:dGTP triphosphohydrolase